tara:strand:- start:88 stop:309 length:222 start_codon:yes stop_codon:yes gene_type:complete
MKLVLFVALALADDPKPEPPPTPPETVVEQAVEMNERLSEILVRVEEMKTEDDATASVESEPIKRVEASPETK